MNSTTIDQTYTNTQHPSVQCFEKEKETIWVVDKSQKDLVISDFTKFTEQKIWLSSNSSEISEENFKYIGV